MAQHFCQSFLLIFPFEVEDEERNNLLKNGWDETFSAEHSGNAYFLASVPKMGGLTQFKLNRYITLSMLCRLLLVHYKIYDSIDKSFMLLSSGIMLNYPSCILLTSANRVGAER